VKTHIDESDPVLSPRLTPFLDLQDIQRERPFLHRAKRLAEDAFSLALESLSLPLLISLLLPLVGTRGALHAQELEESSALSQKAIKLLHLRCLSCHNEEDRKGDLVLSSRAGINSANLEFDLLVSGKPESSALVSVLAAEADPHMPPKEQLTEVEIELLTEWIRKGGEWSERALPGNTPIPLAPKRSELRPVPPGITPTLAISLSADGQQLASSLGSRVRVTTNPNSKDSSSSFLTGHRDLIRSLAWNPTTPNRLFSGGYGRIVYWDTEASEPISILEYELSGQITALHFSVDGSTLFAGVSRPGINGEIQCWSVPQLELQAKWNAHQDTIFSIDVTPDGNYLASASGDRSIAFWETDTWQERSRIEAHGTQIMAISFSPNNQRLVTAGTDNQLRVWEWAKGDPLFQLGRHKRGLYATSWAEDGKSIIAGDEKGALYRYTDIQEHSGAASARAAKESKVKSLKDSIQSLTSNSTGDLIYVGTQSGTVHVLDPKGKSLNTFKP
jgi:WD40 repeat protein